LSKSTALKKKEKKKKIKKKRVVDCRNCRPNGNTIVMMGREEQTHTSDDNNFGRPDLRMSALNLLLLY